MVSRGGYTTETDAVSAQIVPHTVSGIRLSFEPGLKRKIFHPLSSSIISCMQGNAVSFPSQIIYFDERSSFH